MLIIQKSYVFICITFEIREWSYLIILMSSLRNHSRIDSFQKKEFLFSHSFRVSNQPNATILPTRARFVNWIAPLFFFLHTRWRAVNFMVGWNYSPNPRWKASEAIPMVNLTLQRYTRYKITLSSCEHAVISAP